MLIRTYNVVSATMLEELKDKVRLEQRKFNCYNMWYKEFHKR